MSIDPQPEVKKNNKNEGVNRTPSYEDFIKIYNKIDQKYQNALQKLAKQ